MGTRQLTVCYLRSSSDIGVVSTISSLQLYDTCKSLFVSMRASANILTSKFHYRDLRRSFQITCCEMKSFPKSKKITFHLRKLQTILNA